MRYNASIDLNAMRLTAKADLVSARILWNVGLIAQSIWLLQQSAEKYLKYLWSQNKVFSDQKHLECQLKCLGHNLKTIFDGLEPSIKKKIKSQMWLVRLDGLRYSGSFGYSYTQFRSAEKFINDIRKILKENIQKNHFDEWKSTNMRMHKQLTKERETERVIKSILSLTNARTKKERIADRRQWESAIAALTK